MTNEIKMSRIELPFHGAIYHCQIDDAFRLYPLEADREKAWELIEDSIDASQYSGTYPKQGPGICHTMEGLKRYIANNNLYDILKDGSYGVYFVVHADGQWGVHLSERTPFLSTFRKIWNWRGMPFPEWTGERIMMMPVRLGDCTGVPERYTPLVSELYGMVEQRFIKDQCIGYLTIDEQDLPAGKTLRRPGLHVDGYYHGNAGAWGGGPDRPGGSWGSVGNGMLTVSSTAHCRGYLGMVYGKPGDEGEADHLVLPNEGTLFDAGDVYWVDGACIHESLPVDEPTKRQFIRLSMPNNGPWFEGYTENPDPTIKPTGPILPRRDLFMS